MRLIYIFLASLFFLANFSYASSNAINNNATNPENQVNILTWWGYLDWAKPLLKKIGKQCHAQISFDDYYSYNEFLNRVNNPNNTYDILIFSDTVSQRFIKRIGIPSSKLYKLAQNYMPATRNHYYAMHYPHNVVYFEHAVMALVYNPKVIKINQDNNLFAIFKKAGNHIVVMVDDPVEANMLLTMAMTKNYKVSNKLVPLTLDSFKKLMHNTKLIITNAPWHIIQLPDFALAFQWSGDAITMVEKNPQLKLFIDPKTSYITSDMLAELNTQAATQCVARALSSKQFLKTEENHTFYISPYGGSSGSKNKLYQKSYKDIMAVFPDLPWIRSVSTEKLSQIAETWALIKLKITQEEDSLSPSN